MDDHGGIKLIEDVTCRGYGTAEWREAMQRRIEANPLWFWDDGYWENLVMTEEIMEQVKEMGRAIAAMHWKTETYSV